MLKFRIYFDKDEETEWLNEMSKEGWALEQFFAGFYRFAQCEPGKFTYQVDFGERLFQISDEYREFMEETGVEIVQTWGYWVFLRKLTSEGEFKLYTDVDSSIEHYSKICKMFHVVLVIETIILFFELYAGMNGVFLGYPCACLIGAMTIAIANALFKTKDTIAKLQERKGEAASRDNRNVSLFLVCGLLLNSCALIISESVSQPVKTTIQIIAIVFMLLGVYRTGKKRNK